MVLMTCYSELFWGLRTELMIHVALVVGANTKEMPLETGVFNVVLFVALEKRWIVM